MFLLKFLLFIFFAPIILLALRLLGLMFRPTPHNGEKHQSNSTQQRRGWSFTSRTKEQKKVFDKDEGEYVDFEEITDEKP